MATYGPTNTGADCNLQAGAANTTTGSSVNMTIGKTGTLATTRCRGLYRWDMSATIPSGSTVQTATFDFYVNTVGGGGLPANSYAWYRLRRTDWVESEATWNSYKSGSAWTTAGAEDYSNDNDTSVADLAAAITTTGYKTMDVTNCARDAVVSRSQILNVLVWSGEANSRYIITSTKENGTDANRPKLTVTYTPPGGGGNRIPRRPGRIQGRVA